MSTYQVSLEQFTGPLDLLWHLIRTEDLDILDLDLARVTDTYLKFIDEHGVSKLADAYHFLAMAASLVELKSRALLPNAPGADEQDDGETGADPRELLVKQLVAFRSIQEVTGELARRYEQAGRHWQRQVIERMEAEIVYSMESLSAYDLMAVFSEVMGRPRYQQVSIFREPYDIEEASRWLSHTVSDGPVELKELLGRQPDTFALIVTFIALLEMIKGEELTFERAESSILIYLVQADIPL